MDFNSHTTTPHQKHHPKPSTSDLMSSAKLVAEAAKATFSHESNNVDKAKVAGAAENLLNAASSYGKLDEKGFGKYVEQAENYLHKYHSSHSPTTGSGQHSATTTGSVHHSATTTAAPTGHSSSHSGGDDQSGSGYGDYIKLAQGFLKKH